MEEDVQRLGELKEQIDAIKPLKEEYDMLRQEVLFKMTALESDKTRTYGGYYALRQERPNIVIDDPETVEQWLLENGYHLEEYKKLDNDRVKALNEQLEKEYKVSLPGTRVVTSEFVTVKKKGN